MANRGLRRGASERPTGRCRPPHAPASSCATRVLPMDLKVGDRLVDETGEWEVVSRPYTSNTGKDAHARVQKVSQPGVTEVRAWGAHERISVNERARRETSDETTKNIDHIDGGSTLLGSPECRNVLNPAQEFVNDEPDGRQPQHRTKYQEQIRSRRFSIP